MSSLDNYTDNYVDDYANINNIDADNANGNSRKESLLMNDDQYFTRLNKDDSLYIPPNPYLGTNEYTQDMSNTEINNQQVRRLQSDQRNQRDQDLDYTEYDEYDDPNSTIIVEDNFDLDTGPSTSAYTGTGTGTGHNRTVNDRTKYLTDLANENIRNKEEHIKLSSENIMKIFSDSFMNIMHDLLNINRIKDDDTSYLEYIKDILTKDDRIIFTGIMIMLLSILILIFRT